MSAVTREIGYTASHLRDLISILVWPRFFFPLSECEFKSRNCCFFSTRVIVPLCDARLLKQGQDTSKCF